MSTPIAILFETCDNYVIVMPLINNLHARSYIEHGDLFVIFHIYHEDMIGKLNEKTAPLPRSLFFAHILPP